MLFVRTLVSQLWLILLFSATAITATGPKKSHVHDASFTPDKVLHISKINASIACTSAKPVVVVNGTSPGPLIRLRAGRTTWIRVYNDMKDENTTMHWHGLSARVAPFSDGTPLASQWPIPPGHYFDYEVHPLTEESGSYFYHSHVGFQAVTAGGPLIVDEPRWKKAPYDYDGERVFMVSELYNRTDDSIIHGLVAKPFVWSGEPLALLVNGRSVAIGNQTNSTSVPEIFEVEPEKTYRFRFIGASALTNAFIALQNHTNLTVIAADGGYTKAVSTDHIQVGAGQRFDVLLKTKSRAEIARNGNQTDYWFSLGTAYRPTVVPGHAVLRYKLDGKICKSPCFKPGVAPRPISSVGQPLNVTGQIPIVGDNTTNAWLEYQLTPLKKSNFPIASEVTRRVFLSNVQVKNKNQQLPQEVNNHTWISELLDSGFNSTPNGRPYLTDIYLRGQDAIPSIESADAYHQQELRNDSSARYTGWDPNYNAYPAEMGEVLEIVLLNEAGSSNNFDVHPWHAHGAHYYDIGSGPGEYDADANERKLKGLHRKNGFVPARRDTTMLYRWPADNKVNQTTYSVGGWRAWRVRVTDPGVWMIHCHSLQHMIIGMQTVWVMGDAAQIVTRNTSVTDEFVAFGANVTGGRRGYLNFDGKAYGRNDRWPTVMHHFG